MKHLALALLGVGALVLTARPAGAQELPPPPVVAVRAGGTLEGTLQGKRSYTTYGGDEISEEINCSISMRFAPSGGVAWQSGTYRYQKTYRHFEQGQEIMRAETVLTGEASRGESRRSVLKLRVSQTNPPLVQLATWEPVEMPGQFELKTVLRGKTSGSPPRSVLVYCEPHVRWRGPQGTGPGLPLTGNYDGRDGIVAKAWVYNLPEVQPPPPGARNFHEDTRIRVQWSFQY